MNKKFDLKEQMFRHFERVLSPEDSPIVVTWWDKPDSEEASDITPTLVLIDPLDIVAAGAMIKVDRESLVGPIILFFNGNND